MRKQRGIVLMISIVLAVVMIMFVGAALSLAPSQLGAGALTVNQLEAQRAAESGVQYCLSQLRKNPSWRGDQNGVTVNSSDLYVEEDNGNVVGLVRTPAGQWSQFKVRFNYQDGAANADGLDDPASLRIDNPFVSVNNLMGSVPVEVPRADGPGWSVTPASTRPYACPLWSVCLAVEGRAGQLDATPGNVLGSAGRGTVRTVETVCQVPDMDGTVDDAATMAARDFSVVMPPGPKNDVVVSSKAPGRLARIRSKGAMSVKGGDASQNYRTSGEVSTPDQTLDARYDASLVIRQEKPIDPFYQLAWDQVKQANPAGQTMSAGVYVWWEADKQLHYYDMDYSKYVTHIRANPDDAGVAPAVLPSSIKKAGDYKLRIEESTYVKPTASTDDLSLITRRGAPVDPPPTATGTEAMANSIAGDVLDSGNMLPVILETGQASKGDLSVVDSKGNPVFNLEWDNLSTSPTYSFKPTGDVSAYDATRFFLDPSLYPGWSIGGQTGYTSAVDSGMMTNVVTKMGALTATAPGSINPPGVVDSLQAQDLSLEFKGEQNVVVLSSPGDIRLTGAVKGKGGSLTAGGDIRLTGVGSGSLAASTSSDGDGVNIYASGDVFLTSLTEKGSGYQYRDVHFKGVIYTWGNFVAKLGSPLVPDSAGKLKLEGTLIAYGGDPKQAPGSNGRGAVTLRARNVELKFDPSYLGGISQSLPANFELEPMSWNTNLKP